MGETQLCSTPGCASPAAFKTRSRSSWCQDCLAAILREAGMEPVEPLNGGLTTWWLTRCLSCGAEAHYRLQYILDKTRTGEKPCRICFWEQWAAEARERRFAYLPADDPLRLFTEAMEELLTRYTPEQIYAAYPTEDVRWFLDSRIDNSREGLSAYAAERGWELLKTAQELGRSGPGFTAKCRSCGRITVARHGDLSTPCGCITKGTSRLASAGQKRGRQLLADSDSELLKWWDHERNDESVFKTVSLLARGEVHWRCPDCDHQFVKKVADMTRFYGHSRCPKCQRRKVEERSRTDAQWAQTPVAGVPQLAAAWADDAADPATTMVGDKGLFPFRCGNGHTPRMRPATFLRNGCPYCKATRPPTESLAEAFPEIAAQWHPNRNSARYTPGTVKTSSGRRFWWRADCCGYEWEDPVSRRWDSVPAWRCPRCRTILGSLAYENPDIAAEWSPNNPKTAWQVSPIAATSFLPEWICSADPTHVWQAPTKNRTSGSGCPQCRETGKSRVELDYCSAAAELFGDARSGVVLRHPAFTERSSWSADISVAIAGRPVVIEYDGSYWHSDEAQISGDERKSRDLLNADYIVVRLRETGLPSLSIDHPGYLELEVYPQAPRPVPVMRDVRKLLEDRGFLE